MKFELVSNFEPTGDQPAAIEKITKNIQNNVDQHVLLGVTGSGKSVTGETDVLVLDSFGGVTLTPIGEIIDKLFTLFQSKIEYIYDSEVINTSSLPESFQYKAFSFNSHTKKMGWKAITQFTRHTSPRTIYTVHTNNGREVSVTGNHNFFVLRNNLLELVRTEELTNRDYIPQPRYIEEPSHPITSLNLVEHLPANEKYYVAISWEAIQYTEYRQLISQYIPYNKLYRVEHSNERIPLAAFNQLASVLPALTETAKVGTRHKKYQFALDLPITTELLRFLGYFIGDGHTEERYTILSAAESEIIDDFKKTYRTLGIHVAQRPQTYDYVIQSVLWTTLLKKWCGTHAVNKHLPSFWPQLSSANLAALLQGYFSTDGGVDGVTVSATTASKKLASDICYALLRYGISARIAKRYKRLPDSIIRHAYWLITISGRRNLTLFQQQIGFFVKRKNIRLNAVIASIENTNVDLIPIEGRWIKQMRKLFFLTQQEVASSCSIIRSYISLLENNKRKPSLTVFTNILQYFEQKAIQLKNSEALISIREMHTFSSLFWTRIEHVEPIKGGRYVYDFSVEENETFLAGIGGVFVHNTFTMANVIQKIQRPTLVISHNKTLAGQLYQEFRDFFPKNAVSYFVSYYDYYQPEAYIASSDTYIEKEAEINEEIDKLRLSATANLLTRNDVIVVASVSCIYNIGSPVEYGKFVLELADGMKISQKDILVRLTDLQYDRNDYEFSRGSFRVRGSSIDLFPAYMDNGIRIDITDDKVQSIVEFSPLTGDTITVHHKFVIYPAKHYMTDPTTYSSVFPKIKSDLDKRVAELRAEEKHIEAQRLNQRTTYDLEMIQEVGYVNGIENYSSYFDGRKPGEAPYTLLDYFNHNDKEWLLIVDESHITLPQVRGMYNGDQSRKQSLIDYGFRLPSALDNRPLRYEEFARRTKQTVYVSATPNEYELSLATGAGEDTIVEQLIRPTGLVDPIITVKPTKGQIEDLISEITKRTEKGERVLVTTLTKRMSEELTSYLEERKIKVAYLHSDIITLERQDVLDRLRLGEYDVLVGINLLREGLDLPEVSLVVILDADKEGFLRSRSSLIQTMGRAARHVNSQVILYADRITDSMKAAMGEVERRREVQLKYNQDHNITPVGIEKAVRAKLIEQEQEEKRQQNLEELVIMSNKDVLLPDERDDVVRQLRREMKAAAERLDFEAAMRMRDRIRAIEGKT